MTVGVDLRIFQIGHQYRGIGAHISNLFREFAKMKDLPNFVFFEHPNVDSGLDVIKEYLPKFNYEVRHTNIRLVGETYLQREWASFKQRNIDGDAGLKDLSGIDILLSIDFNLGVPKPSKIKTVLISYDMIPWVLSETYLPNFSQTYKRTKNIKRATKATIDKKLYFHKFKQANRRAHKILAISEHTKNDITKYLHIKPKKIETILLGIDPSKARKQKETISTKRVTGKATTFSTKKNPYVFFMGGADRRRRIEDLVKAFDAYAQSDKDFHLLLAGYDFQALETVPDETARNAIINAKNKDRILFAGFISDEERSALFACAQAFVFPSVYEGFGLPILEAMNLNCPVITYKNSSITEVGGDAVLYADGSEDIENHIRSLMTNDELRHDLLNKGQEKVKEFSWEKTAQTTLKALTSIN